MTPTTAVLDVEREHALAAACRAGDVAARDALVLSVVPLVASLAAFLSRGRTVDVEDLRQAAAVRLLQCASQFDPSRGVKFSTWAGAVATRAIRDALARSFVVRGRAGVVRETGVSFRLADVPSPDDDDARRREDLLDFEALVAPRLACLRDRERFVITRMFGLDGEPRETLERIGGKLGVTKERARQIGTAGMARLEASLRRGARVEPYGPPASSSPEVPREQAEELLAMRFRARLRGAMVSRN